MQRVVFTVSTRVNVKVFSKEQTSDIEAKTSNLGYYSQKGIEIVEVVSKQDLHSSHGTF